MNVGDRVTITRNGVPVFRAVVERVVPMNGRAQLHQIEHCDGRPVKSTGRYRDVATLRLHVLLRSGRVVDPDAGYGGELKAEVERLRPLASAEMERRAIAEMMNGGEA